MPRIAFFFEHFSLQHALSTLIISTLAIALSSLYPSDQTYWLLLSSILLSQAGLRSELDWQAWWQPLYYLACAFVAAIVVLILSLAAPHFLISLILLSLTTLISNYLGWLNRKFFFAAFFINLLAIIAIFSPLTNHIYLILIAGLIVFLVRLPFFLYQRSRKADHAWMIFLQKLQTLYRLIFDIFQEADEKRFQAAWCDGLSALERVKKIGMIDPQVENIWDLSLSLGALRYRITDKAILTMSQDELKSISNALTSIINQAAHHASTIDFKPLDIAIQRLEDLYQNMLQTVTPEPLVLLLFIQDLRTLKEVLEKYLSSPYRPEPPPCHPESPPCHPERSEGSHHWSRRSFANAQDDNEHYPLLPSFFPLQRALRSASAVFVALIIGHYFFPAHRFWLAIVATLLTQTEMGLPFHQILQRALWIIMVLLLGSEILNLLPTNAVPALLISLITLLSYGYAYTSRRYLSLHLPLLIMIMSLLLILIPAPTLHLLNFLGVVIGALIAMISSLLIFPDKPDLEFTSRVLPLLENLATYFTELVDLLRDKKQLPYPNQARTALEHCWGNRDDYFPVWVFEPGYNPALFAGHYYFVVRLGQITEILFAMTPLAQHRFAADILAPMTTPLKACATHTQALFDNLIHLLQGGKSSFQPADYLDDITTLEETFRKNTPITLELLDLSHDDITLAAFIRYLKDLRLQLLQLASTFK